MYEKREDVNSDWYYKYCRNYDYDDCPIYKGDSSSRGCYLTSACVDAKEIYEMIYNEMVKPCVEMIEKGKMEEAMEVYKKMTLKLQEQYC